MKIVHVITDLNTGGAEHALYNILNSDPGIGFHHHVICLGAGGKTARSIRELDVPVTKLNMQNGMVPFVGLRKLFRLVRSVRPDVIQGWMYHGNLIAFLAAKVAPGDPALVWNVRHSLYDFRFEKLATQMIIFLNRLLSAQPDVLLYNSQKSKSQHENKGFSSMNGRVIPNGIDLEKFKFSDKARWQMRKRLGIPGYARVIGHFARFHPIKDHPEFLRIASLLVEKYPEVHVVMCGREVSPVNQELNRLIPIGLQHRFHLLDERDDIPELLSCIDVFCLSSASEAFPNILGEAMSVGVPCVTTNVGDCAMIVGDTGISVVQGDSAALFKALESFLIMPDTELDRLSARARSRIESNYGVEKMADEYAELYCKIAPSAAG